MEKSPGSLRSGSAARTAIERFAIADRRRLSGPGLRALLAIADLWGLTEQQRRLILGYPAQSTYHGWIKKARERRDITLNLDVLMRISAVLGIYKGLRTLFADDDKAVEWLKGLHKAPVFAGASPIELITSGEQDAALTVRRFLDAACGGLYMAPSSDECDRPPYDDSEIIFDGADD